MIRGHKFTFVSNDKLLSNPFLLPFRALIHSLIQVALIHPFIPILLTLLIAETKAY